MVDQSKINDDAIITDEFGNEFDRVTAINDNNINEILEALRKFIAETENFDCSYVCEVTTDITADPIDPPPVVKITWIDNSSSGIYVITPDEDNWNVTIVTFIDQSADNWLVGDFIPDIFNESVILNIAGPKGEVDADDYDLEDDNELIDIYLDEQP